MVNQKQKLRRFYKKKNSWILNILWKSTYVVVLATNKQTSKVYRYMFSVKETLSAISSNPHCIAGSV